MDEKGNQHGRSGPPGRHGCSSPPGVELGREQGSSQESWLLLRYRPTSLFSLRMTHATNKGGRTLLVPTPYAFKLALVDAAFRAWPGREALLRAQDVFRTVAGLTIRFSPPDSAVVQHTFIKVRQARRDSAPGLYEPTIVFREYVHYRGDLTVAVAAPTLSAKQLADLTRAGAHVQYIGKRGSFFQYLGSEIYKGPLPPGFTAPESPQALLTGWYGSTQYLDDFAVELSRQRDAWDRVSTYGSKPLRLGKDRVLVRTLLPYRVKAEGHSFTAYERPRR